MIWENGKLLIFVLGNIKLANRNTLVVPTWSSMGLLPYIGIYYRFRERASLYLEQTDKCCETEK